MRKDFSNIKQNDIIETKSGNFYIIINRVQDQNRKVVYFSGQRITNPKTKYNSYEKTSYLTWTWTGVESGEETYSYTGNDAKTTHKLSHNQEVRIFGEETIKIYLDYGNDFNGLFKVEDHSKDEKSMWLK